MIFSSRSRNIQRETRTATVGCCGHNGKAFHRRGIAGGRRTATVFTQGQRTCFIGINIECFDLNCLRYPVLLRKYYRTRFVVPVTAFSARCQVPIISAAVQNFGVRLPLSPHVFGEFLCLGSHAQPLSTCRGIFEKTSEWCEYRSDQYAHDNCRHKHFNKAKTGAGFHCKYTFPVTPKIFIVFSVPLVDCTLSAVSAAPTTSPKGAL